MALEDMARPNIVNNTKISGRFTNEGKDVNKAASVPTLAKGLVAACVSFAA